MPHDGTRFRFPQVRQAQRLPCVSGATIEVGDLLYWTGSAVRRMSDYTGSGTAILDQSHMSRNFAGVAMEGRLATQTGTGIPGYPGTGVLVATDCVYEADCTSATFTGLHTPVGIVSAAAGAAGDIGNNSVVAVSRDSLAIGHTLERFGSATTKVLVRLKGQCFPGNGAFSYFNGLGGKDPCASENAADTAPTLTVNSAMIQVGVPTTARTYVLPAVASSQGKIFIVVNNSAGANTITVNNAGGTTIGTVAQNKRSLFVCDGSAWYAITGA